MAILDLKKYPTYVKACKFAETAHAGQFYGDSDKPYMYHLLNVANIVAERNHGKVDDEYLDRLLAAAMLHDVIEDTDVDGPALVAAGFDLSLTLDVIVLTKYDDESYADYIESFRENPTALEVKICDTATNLEHSVRSGSIKRIEKYSKQLKKLNKMQQNGRS